MSIPANKVKLEAAKALQAKITEQTADETEDIKQTAISNMRRAIRFLEAAMNELELGRDPAQELRNAGTSVSYAVGDAGRHQARKEMLKSFDLFDALQG